MYHLQKKTLNNLDTAVNFL